VDTTRHRLRSSIDASVAIDGSKFKAANTRDWNFTQAKMQRRLEQIDESINVSPRSRSSVLIMSASSDMLFQASYE
jgi:hypothetical protein